MSSVTCFAAVNFMAFSLSIGWVDHVIVLHDRYTGRCSHL